MHQDDFEFIRDLPHVPSAEALDFMLRHIANSIEFDLANVPTGHFPILTRHVCDKALAVTTLLAARQKTEHPEVVAAQLDPKTVKMIEEMLRAFAAMSKSVNERMEKSAQDTHREIVSVTKSFDELRRIKEVLQKMQNEKLFGFVTKIRPNDFRALCAILAKGDMAKAARALNLSKSTVKGRVRLWRTRGPAYKVLLEMVRWRKKIGQKGTVPVPESVLQNTASHTDYAGILADVLEEILAMTEENWQEKAEHWPNCSVPSFRAKRPKKWPRLAIPAPPSRVLHQKSINPPGHQLSSRPRPRHLELGTWNLELLPPPSSVIPITFHVSRFTSAFAPLHLCVFALNPPAPNLQSAIGNRQFPPAHFPHLCPSAFIRGQNSLLASSLSSFPSVKSAISPSRWRPSSVLGRESVLASINFVCFATTIRDSEQPVWASILWWAWEANFVVKNLCA
jgi:hypothetical protein